MVLRPRPVLRTTSLIWSTQELNPELWFQNRSHHHFSVWPGKDIELEARLFKNRIYSLFQVNRKFEFNRFSITKTSRSILTVIPKFKQISADEYTGLNIRWWQKHFIHFMCTGRRETAGEHRTRNPAITSPRHYHYTTFVCFIYILVLKTSFLRRQNQEIKINAASTKIL